MQKSLLLGGLTAQNPQGFSPTRKAQTLVHGPGRNWVRPLGRDVSLYYYSGLPR